ncbi:MAG: hypothetical protein ACKVOK_08450 [Flavobacteriales bacterium]
MISIIKIPIAIIICLFCLSSYTQFNPNMKYSELNSEIFYAYIDYDRIGTLKDIFNTKTITKIDVIGQDTIGTTIGYYNQKGEISQSIARHQTGSFETKYYKFDSIGQLTQLVKLFRYDTVYSLNIQYESNLVKSMVISGSKAIDENRIFEYYPDSSLKKVQITRQTGIPYSCGFDYHQGDNGLMVTVTRRSNEDSLWDITKWQFDSRYKLMSQIIYTNNKENRVHELHYKHMGRKSTTTYAYRGYKLEKSTETRDKNGSLTKRKIIPYHRSEKAISNVYMNEGIILVQSEYGRWTYFYDNNNRRTKTYSFAKRFWPFVKDIMITSYDNFDRVIKSTSIYNDGTVRSITASYETW